MFELCPMSSDFHEQPHVNWPLWTLHCLFDQSHGTLPCSIACIPMCFVTTKHILKPSFQILMWHGVLFFSVLLRRCGLVLASHLGDPSLFILQERLEQLHLDVLTPPSGRTRRLATGEPVNIPADFDLDSLYVEVLRTLCSQMSLPTSGTRSRSSNSSKK